MEKKSRKSGIDLIGDVSWGTHFCQFYHTKKDLIDILGPYFKAGLENNEFCIWVTSESLKVEEAKAALKKKVKNLDDYIKKGQIEILYYSEWYANSKGKLNLDEVLKNWVKKENHALKKGFDGIRVTGNTYWLEKKDWKKFVEYESVFDSIINKYKMIAICSYSLEKCGASDIIDVISNHEFALIRREDKWEVIESTQHKKVEEVLKKSEAKFSNLYNTAPIGYHSVDDNGYILDMNKTELKWLGYRKKEIIGKKTIFDLQTKESAKKGKEFFQKLKKKGRVKNLELEMQRKDGTSFPVILNATFLYDENGKFIMSNTAVIDYTKHKKVEENLRETRNYLENLLNYANAPIIVWDPEFKITRFNRAFERLTDYSSDEVIGKDLCLLFPKESMDDSVEKINNTLRGEYWESVEILILCKNRDLRVMLWNSANIHTEDGSTLIATIAQGLDITERKKMEQMMFQSEKMASIGTLAAGVAHEINNPMGYISSNLRMLLKYYEKNKNFYTNIQKLIEEYAEEKTIIDKFLELKEDTNIGKIVTDMKDATEETIEGAEKVIKIVSDLREFAREEKPKMGKGDINRGIENILNIIWNELKYKAEVIKEFGDIPKLECDIQRLEQVFMNVLINAAQAIEEHGIIKIRTFSDYNSVVIQISDTGMGIPEEEINKIFDPFYTTKAPDKGTGLGLSIAYKIIQEHNGKIDVESEEGKGTTFTIKLPVKKYEEIIEYKILIVDDDKSIREILNSMINEYNPSILVKTAKDGFEAGDLLNTFLPDVVLLDIKMSGIDGFEICRRIRADEKMENIKVVMITGYTAEFLKEDCLEAGAIEFLKKPIKLKTLYKTLDKIIKG